MVDRRLALALSLAIVLWAGSPQSLDAHGGGTPRLMGSEAGPYRVYAWSDPDPWRVGEVHLSMMVGTLMTDSATNARVEVPVSEAEIVVMFIPTGRGRPIVAEAAPIAPGAFYYEVIAQLPRAGDWAIDISINGTAGSGNVGFVLAVEPNHSITRYLPILAILLGTIGFAALISRKLGANVPLRPQHLGKRRRARNGIRE